MPAAINIIGERFGRLIVTAESEPARTCKGWPVRQSLCLCDCGKEIITLNGSLRSGATQSCGCLRREITGSKKRTHGQSGRNITRTYRMWRNMIERCENHNNPKYEYYGARGVTIHPTWRASFQTFIGDVGECPPGLEIDRWPNQKGNYEPGNIRYATGIQQARNTQRNHIVTVNGITGCVSELCEIFGIDPKRIYKRLSAGWSTERAFFTPKLR